MTTTTRICSIDIGMRNFAYCIEEYDEKDEMFFQGKLLHYENIMLGSGTRVTFDVMANMVYKLNENKALLETCKYIVVEKQMQTNNMAIKLGQHCLSYFMLCYHNIYLVDFASTHKTQALDAPKKMSYIQRKKWSIQTAIRILELRNDEHHLEQLRSSKKADDLADVLCQAIAFKKCLWNKKKSVLKNMHFIQ